MFGKDRLDRHLMPGYRERMGIMNETDIADDDEDIVYDDVDHHEGDDFDTTVNFYEHPYHGDEAEYYHEARIEDTNPDDHDAHHGP